MADNTANAVIVLSAGEPIKVKQTVEEIKSLVADALEGVSFFCVVDTRGKDHWVNVHELVEYHEPPDSSGTFA